MCWVKCGFSRVCVFMCIYVGMYIQAQEYDHDLKKKMKSFLSFKQFCLYFRIVHYSVTSIWNCWNYNGFQVFHFTEFLFIFIFFLNGQTTFLPHFYADYFLLLFVYHNTSYQKRIVNHANIATKMCLLIILIDYLSGSLL